MTNPTNLHGEKPNKFSSNEKGAFLEYELELEHSKYASPDNNVSFDPWTREPEIVD